MSWLLFSLLVHLGLSLYCGSNNCYALLEVSESATIDEIKKSFRRLAKEHHPDINKDSSLTTFQNINIAYEILSDENTRREYDRYLKDPSQGQILNYYRYYKACYLPHTNPFVVIFLFLSLMSLLHYTMRKSMNESAVRSIMQSDKFKRAVNDRWDGVRDKEDIRQELKEEIQIQGGYSPPKLKEILIVRLVMMPINLARWLYSSARWIYLYRIRKLEYGDQEKELLTIDALKGVGVRWASLGESDRQAMIAKKLWEKANLDNFVEESRKSYMESMQGTNRYKQYKRMLKKYS